MAAKLDGAFNLAVDRQVLGADDLALNDQSRSDPGGHPPFIEHRSRRGRQVVLPSLARAFSIRH